MNTYDFFSDTLQRSSSERIDILKASDSCSDLDSFVTYGYDYYDNPDLHMGYGGYYYDGRFKHVAKRIMNFYGLQPRMKILEIGCAKGFLLYEFHKLGLECVAIEISKYAIANSPETLKKSIINASATHLPFFAQSFDFVICKEVLPHLNHNETSLAIQEMHRVSKDNHIFLEIQCAETSTAKELMKKWDPTHKTIESKSWWRKHLEILNYRGNYHLKELFNGN